MFIIPSNYVLHQYTIYDYECMDINVKTRQCEFHNTILYNPLYHEISSPNSPLHYQVITSTQSTRNNQQKSQQYNHDQHVSLQINKFSQSTICIKDE
jgi:hypothetical protein